MIDRNVENRDIQQPAYDPTDYVTRLRLHGFRVTPIVTKVVDILHASGRPLSYSDLTRALSVRSRKGLDRVTLYRILSRLTASGVAFRRQALDGTCYFALAEHSVVGYFECAHCHRVHMLTTESALPSLLNQLNRVLGKQGIGTADVSLIVQGTCGQCNTREC